MFLKLNGHYCSVLLLYSVLLIINLPSAGRCERTAPPFFVTHPSVLSDLPPTESSSDRPQRSADGRDGPTHLPGPENHRDGPGSGSETNSSRSRPEQRLKRRMVSAFGEKNLFYWPRPPSGRWVSSLHSPAHGNCSKGEIRRIVPGKFYIPGQLEANIPSLGYQSDSAASAGQAQRGEGRNKGQRVSGSEESWQKLQPVVECGDDAMTLTVRRRRAVQLLLHRENDSSVPVSQLSPHCGYSVVTSWRDLSLMAQYDACQVIREDGSYVLPLLWRGAPVKMSCPVPPFLPPAVGPSSLCCFPSGMTVKIPGQRVNEEHLVNVRGEWTPLVQLSEQCGYTLDQQGAEMVISAPFITCGITEKDGKYTLTLDVANKVFTLACPVASSEELPVSHQAELTGPSHLTSGPPTPVLGSLEPFQWLPPYYLAPPYYPHPTFHHVFSHPDDHAPAMPSSAPIQNMVITPTPQSLFHPLPDYRDYFPKQNTPNKPYGEPFPRSPSTIDEEEEPMSKEHLHKKNQGSRNKVTPIYDYSEMQRSPPTGFPAQLEAPHAQPPRHDFSPYYHYYHHPKIPLPGFPFQENVFGPKELSTIEQHLQFPLLPPEAQETQDVGNGNSDRFISPVPRTGFHPQAFPAIPNHINHPPALYVAYPQQPYPYQYYYYFPHVARGEAKKLSPLPPDKPLKTNLPVDPSRTYTPVSPSPNKDNTQAYLDEDNAPVTDVKEESAPLLSEDHEKKEEFEEGVTRPSPRSFPSATHPVAVPFPDRHSTPNKLLNYTSYPYHYHPYYDYYKSHYGPEGLLGAYNNMHPVPLKSAEPHFQVSSFPAHPPMPLPPPYSNPNGAISPYYYYYYLYYQPEVSKGHQEVQPSSQMNLKTSDSPLSSKSKYNSMEMVVQKTADNHILHPMPNPLNSIYSRYTSQQHARHPVGLTAAGEKTQNNDRKDYSKTNVHSTSRCGFGSELDPDCLNSKDCCSHTIKDCTLGQYFVFAVPYSMVGPTVVPTVRSSDGRNMSCALRRLNSDLDIYIVPLDGCGVNKHMFGQTVLHLLDLQGVHRSRGGNAPVRFTVGCSSSIGSPGEVMFHVMDQPSLTSAASVRLRIATDETFSGYHSEAHLPFSHIRGRPVYVEVSLPDPQEPGLALLLHSCLAYTQSVYASSVLVYDGCQDLSVSQLLPSKKSHIKKIRISSFLPPPPESFQHVAKGGHGSLKDPEIHFMCLTEVCSAVDGGCTLGCINSPPTDM